MALEEALPDVLDASVGELNFKNVVGKLGDIMYKYPFSLPPFYIAIIRCLGVLEGLAIQVDRDFRIISDAYPYIASRLLTDPQPELRDALRQLLFKDGQPPYRRLEQLLEKASGTRDYDVTEAIEQLANYLTSEEAAPMLDTFSVQLLDVVDQLSLDVAAAVGTTLDELRLLAQAGRFDELSQRLDELLARLSGDAAVGQEDAAPALAAAAKRACSRRARVRCAAACSCAATTSWRRPSTRFWSTWRSVFPNAGCPGIRGPDFMEADAPGRPRTRSDGWNFRRLRRCASPLAAALARRRAHAIAGVPVAHQPTAPPNVRARRQEVLQCPATAAASPACGCSGLSTRTHRQHGASRRPAQRGRAQVGRAGVRGALAIIVELPRRAGPPWPMHSAELMASRSSTRRRRTCDGPSALSTRSHRSASALTNTDAAELAAAAICVAP